MEHLIQLPEGYEFDHIAQPILGNGGGVISVILKKTQQRDFDYFIDQYLSNSSGSTNGEVRNIIDDDMLETLSSRLKKNQFNLVPWEIKIGLFRFICEQNKMDFNDIIGFIVHYKASKCAEFGSAYVGYPVSKVCSYEFLANVLETK